MLESAYADRSRLLLPRLLVFVLRSRLSKTSADYQLATRELPVVGGEAFAALRERSSDSDCGFASSEHRVPLRLTRAISARIAEAHRQVRAAGLEFMGREAVLAQSLVQRAKSYEEKRVLIPRVAANDPIARRVLLGVQKAFRRAYRAAP